MEEGINIISLSNQEQTEIEDGIQQEIITETIEGDETLITVYQVNGSNVTESRELPLDSIADLSALAAAAEFVPILQETLPNDLNSDGKHKSEIEVSAEELSDFNVGDKLDDVAESSQDLNDDTLDCGVADDEGLNELNSVVTPGEYFVTTSFEEMHQIIQDYFDRTDTRFVVQKRTKDFGMTGMYLALYLVLSFLI